MSAARSALETALLDQREALLRLCRNYLGGAADAEDAAGEIGRRLLAAAGAKPIAPADVRAYVFRAARNHCLNLLRGQAREQARLSRLPEPMAGSGPLTRLLRLERADRLHAALSTLPPLKRELLVLRYVHDLARDEIAAILDLEGAAVKSGLFAGLRDLRKALDTLR